MCTLYSFKAMKSECIAENLCVSLCVVALIHYIALRWLQMQKPLRTSATAPTILRNILNCYVVMYQNLYLFMLYARIYPVPIDGPYFCCPLSHSFTFCTSTHTHIHIFLCIPLSSMPIFMQCRKCVPIYLHFSVKMLRFVSSTLYVSQWFGFGEKGMKGTLKKRNHCRYKKYISFNFAGIFVSRSVFFILSFGMVPVGHNIRHILCTSVSTSSMWMSICVCVCVSKLQLSTKTVLGAMLFYQCSKMRHFLFRSLPSTNYTFHPKTTSENLFLHIYMYHKRSSERKRRWTIKRRMKHNPTIQNFYITNEYKIWKFV